jgi:hypothetical protein
MVRSRTIGGAGDDGRPHDVSGRHDDRVWLDNRAVLLDAKQPMSAFGSSGLRNILMR